jgi:hypothetical protein
LQIALTGRWIKIRHLTADEVDILHLLKILADIDQVAKDLSGGATGTDE